MLLPQQHVTLAPWMKHKALRHSFAVKVVIKWTDLFTFPHMEATGSYSFVSVLSLSYIVQFIITFIWCKSFTKFSDTLYYPPTFHLSNTRPSNIISNRDIIFHFLITSVWGEKFCIHKWWKGSLLCFIVMLNIVDYHTVWDIVCGWVYFRNYYITRNYSLNGQWGAVLSPNFCPCFLLLSMSSAASALVA